MHRRAWLYGMTRYISVFMLTAAFSAGAQTPGYNLIDWNDLMPEPWVKAMTKEMAAVGKLCAKNLTKRLSSNRNLIKKSVYLAMSSPWTLNEATNVSFCWFLILVHVSTRPRHRPTKLC